MTVLAEIYDPQDGASLFRQHQQPTLNSIRIPKELLDELSELSTIPVDPKPPLRLSDNKEPDPPGSVTFERKSRVCRVETILADRFTAIFSAPGLVDQRVVFPRNLVAESDRPLLQEGAVLYWIAAIEHKANGEVMSTASIRFRRRPRLSSRQVEELDKLAEEMIRAGGAEPVDG